MQVSIEGDQRAAVGRLPCELRGHRGDHGCERGALLLGAALGGELCRLRFEHGAQLVDTAEVAVVEVGHERATARQDHDEALPLQPSQRLAHRRQADVEALSQAALIQQGGRR